VAAAAGATELSGRPTAFPFLSAMPTLGRIRYLEARPPSSVRPRGTVVLVHAFPLNARMWEPQLALAADGWHVVAPHLSGFDGGVHDPHASSIGDYAGDVIDLLDGLHVKDAVVGGLSMGGYVAFAMLRHASSYVRALVLADTRAQADSPAVTEGRKRMLEMIGARGGAAADAVADDMVPKLLGASTRRLRPDLVERVRALVTSNAPERIAEAVHVLMTRPDSTPLLHTIHVPTLVLVGAEDTLTPPADAEAMRRAISGARLEVVPGAGHLSNLEQPDRFNEALAAFLTHRV
jgi:3-oxoadipate enol-lactonase